MTSMLGYNTWYAMPRLDNYKEALERYENTKPIRGCPHALRPVGRRDQKWFNIAKGEDGRIVVGYHWLNLGSDQRNALITYMPTGEILIGHTYLTASTRERIHKITGIYIERAQYVNWARTTSYVDGTAVKGYFAMPRNEAAIFVSRTATQASERELIMLNPMPVYKHRLRKGVLASIMGKADGFLRYVEAMTRLTSDRPDLPIDQQEVPRLPWSDVQRLGLPTGGLSIHYWQQDESVVNRAKLFEMIEQGEADPEHWHNAMYWVSNSFYTTSYKMFKTVLRTYATANYRDEVFEKSRGAAGAICRDRHAMFFRW